MSTRYSREAWAAELVRRWRLQPTAAPPRRDAARLAWFRELVGRLAALPGDPHTAALERFRAATLRAPVPFEARIRKRVADRFGPEHPMRAAVSVLETTPDLLSPFDHLRAEVVHTRLLAWTLRPSAALGTEPLRAFLELLARHDCKAAHQALAGELAMARAFAERSVPPEGRVDVWLTLPSSTFAIEVKVDQGEGDDQVLGYRRALERHAAGTTIATVFVTLDGSESSDSDSIDLRWADLLRVWAPVAARADSGDHRYLRAWLASVGSGLCGVGGNGPFAGWHWVHQVHALDLFEEVS